MNPERDQQKPNPVSESRLEAAKALGLEIADQPTSLDDKIKAGLSERFSGPNPDEAHKELTAKWKSNAEFKNNQILNFINEHQNPDFTPNNIDLARSQGDVIKVTGDDVTSSEIASLESNGKITGRALALEALSASAVNTAGQVAEISPLEMAGAIESASYDVFGNSQNGAPAVIERKIVTSKGTIYERHLLQAGDETTAGVQVVFDPSEVLPSSTKLA